MSREKIELRVNTLRDMISSKDEELALLSSENRQLREAIERYSKLEENCEELRANQIVLEQSIAKHEQHEKQLQDQLSELSTMHTKAVKQASELQTQIDAERRGFAERWSDMELSQSSLLEALERSINTTKVLQASRIETKDVHINYG